MKTSQNTIGALSDPVIQKSGKINKGKMYNQFIDALPAAIYTCDAQGRIIFFNSAAAELWGRKPELGKDLWCGSWKIYNTDGSPLCMDECPMAITLKEGRLVRGEEVIVERPDGRRINVMLHPQPIFDSDGVISGAINMLVDITDKKNREIALNESESKYRILSESLEKRVTEKSMNLGQSEDRYHKMIDEVQDYAILLLDKEGTILNWNKGAQKIKGYSEEEILGKNFRIFYQEKDRKEKLPEQLINDTIKKGKAMHEGWRLRKDGEKFWGSIVITALHDEYNNIIGFSKVTRDLTEKKLAEDKLRQYNRDIQLQNKQLEEYAHIASHDLQEPLRKIQIFASLLEKNIDDKAEVKKNIIKINSSAKRMTNLIKDVLNYSRLILTEEHFEATNLTTVLDNIMEDFELLISEKEVVINYHDLPVVMGIPIQLNQLFSNLVSNAIKFAGGKPVIDITSEKLTEATFKKYPQLTAERSYTLITFRDQGIGFDPQYNDQVFKLFQRLDSSTYGNGIGLALCKRIVENHHGIISVSSEVNKGTTFKIILPIPATAESKRKKVR